MVLILLFLTCLAGAAGDEQMSDSLEVQHRRFPHFKKSCGVFVWKTVFSLQIGDVLDVVKL